MNSRRLAALALLAAAMFLPALISPTPAQAGWGGCRHSEAYVDFTPRAIIVEPDGSVTTFADYVPHAGGADIHIARWPSGGCPSWWAIYDSASHYPDYVKAAARQANGKLFGVGYTDKTSIGKGKNWRIIKYSADGVFLWQAGYNNGLANKDDVAEDAVMDYSTTPNSLYVAGWQTNADDSVSMVLQKYAPSSNVALWTAIFEPLPASVGPANPVHVGVDAAGYVYLAGTVLEDEYTETWLVAKYDSDGNLLDSTTFGHCWGMRDFAVDPAGNSYATGWFTVSWDTNLDQRWTQSPFGPDGEYFYGRCLALDDSGNCFISGSTYYGDICYVKKFSGAGGLSWTRYYDPGGGATAETKCMAVDSGGNVIAAGEQSTGAGDFFGARWDPDGNLIWAQPLDWQGLPDSAMVVTTDSSNNTLVAGYSQWEWGQGIVVLIHWP